MLLEGKLELPFRSDSGADCSSLSETLFRQLTVANLSTANVHLESPIACTTGNGDQCEVTRVVLLRLSSCTLAGPVSINTTMECLIPGAGDEFLEAFLKYCLLYHHVKGGKIEQSPWGEPY